jgi:hypothetical protein
VRIVEGFVGNDMESRSREEIEKREEGKETLRSGLLTPKNPIPACFAICLAARLPMVFFMLD